jgi:hypothetical protein
MKTWFEMYREYILFKTNNLLRALGAHSTLHLLHMTISDVDPVTGEPCDEITGLLDFYASSPSATASLAAASRPGSPGPLITHVLLLVRDFSTATTETHERHVLALLERHVHDKYGVEMVTLHTLIDMRRPPVSESALAGATQMRSKSWLRSSQLSRQLDALQGNCRLRIRTYFSGYPFFFIFRCSRR